MLTEAFHRWMGCLGLSSTATCAITPGDAWIVLSFLILSVVLIAFWRKFLHMFFTLRALALTPTLSRFASKWVKSFDYPDEGFFRADGAEEPWVIRRKQALDRLAAYFQA